MPANDAGGHNDINLAKKHYTKKIGDNMGNNLVIIGGGAAGPSAAAEARRNNPSLNITIVEKGKFVSYSA